MSTFGAKSSACGNVNDVAGGRKAIQSIAAASGTDVEAVLVSLGRDDAVVFSDEVEVESAPSLETDEETDDEEEEDWESEEEEDEEYDEEDAELDEGLAERLRILADARALKSLAAAFLHPERPVETTDPAAFGRGYFDRPSAIEQEDDEDADERADILADAVALKEAARAYLHPEEGVKGSAPEGFGRNYFDRFSAPEVEDADEADERAKVLAETAALKKAAVDYMHPEVGVKAADGACFGRNYFNRPSAPEQEEDELADERAEILAEAAALKQAAVDYMHPEVGVKATDGACFGRNFFNRPSAPETEDADEANERAAILAEAAALKQSAVDYMHPEVGVTSADGACFGRNYFDRPSAPEQEEDELADERAEILAEAAALKQAAVDYMHPEVGVKATDGACFGRNYFNRHSAPETEEDELADERAEILAEAAALKQSAMDYMHPEVGVKNVDGACFGRNYFDRPSAPEVEDMDERAAILAEAASLKKLAKDYMHPEVGVTSSDGACFGRNYFDRYSAPETEEDELADERAAILAEAAALKQSAKDYMHPEVGVTSSDGTCFGRNYFNRYSAPEVEDAEEANERAMVLAEAAALKQSAVDYMHPEVGVASADGACFGRNYFERFSAPEVEDDGLANERAEILAEAAALKQSAVDYMHPEIGVTSSDGASFGRNYFNRFSAPEVEEDELANERAEILAEAAALKQSAVDYMHPEIGVVNTDPTSFGRNYFNRFSAPGAEDSKKAPKEEETPEASQDLAAVKNLAAAIKGANLPSTKSVKVSSADTNVDAKTSASSVNLFGLAEEAF